MLRWWPTRVSPRPTGSHSSATGFTFGPRSQAGCGWPGIACGWPCLAGSSCWSLLMGFEAASLRRWTLSRRNWRQLDIVVADDEEAAERRFFDRWTAKQRALSNDQAAVDRGAPPPTRDIPGQAFSKPPPMPGNSIIGLFPEPGASR